MAHNPAPASPRHSHLARHWHVYAIVFGLLAVSFWWTWGRGAPGGLEAAGSAPASSEVEPSSGASRLDPLAVTTGRPYRLRRFVRVPVAVVNAGRQTYRAVTVECTFRSLSGGALTGTASRAWFDVRPGQEVSGELMVEGSQVDTNDVVNCTPTGRGG